MYNEMGDIDKLEPQQTVVGDYKYAMIMDSRRDKNDIMQCTIARFDYSMNTIESIMNEMWKPRLDSYTSYLGE